MYIRPRFAPTAHRIYTYYGYALDGCPLLTGGTARLALRLYTVAIILVGIANALRVSVTITNIYSSRRHTLFNEGI